MTEQEILELIRQHLPRLMQENPQVREWIRELVAQYGITREEWVAFLERFDRLIEAVDRNTEQISRLWQAIDTLREEISLMRQTYDSAIARLEQSVARLDQTVARLDAEVQLLKQAMERGFERLDRRITALGARWGFESERAFRAGLKGILEQRFGVTVTQWRHYDEQGFVFGTPTWVEADVLIHNGEHLLVEVKAHVSRGDISEFRRLGQFYEQVTGVKPRLIIVSPFVDQRAADLAQLWDIAIYEEPEDVPTEEQGDNGQ